MFLTIQRRTCRIALENMCKMYSNKNRYNNRRKQTRTQLQNTIRHKANPKTRQLLCVSRVDDSKWYFCLLGHPPYFGYLQLFMSPPGFRCVAQGEVTQKT